MNILYKRKMKIEEIYAKYVIQNFTLKNFFKTKIYKQRHRQTSYLDKKVLILKLNNKVNNLVKLGRNSKKRKRCIQLTIKKFNQ